MLTSARRSQRGGSQDDMMYSAAAGEADAAFDADTYDLPTPTFFPQQFREIPVRRLADRYRSTRDVPSVPEVITRRPGQSRALQPYPVRAARYSPQLEEFYAPSELQNQPRLKPQARRETHRSPPWAMFAAAGVAAIVLGGGVIGVEFASVWRSFGSDVTIVEALPRLVPNEDEACSKALDRAFRKRGIKAAST